MTALERVEVLPPALDEFAATINREHGLVVRSARATIEHAIKAGEALLAAKDACDSGGWLSWLDENIEMHPTTAMWYMRVAYQAEAVRASGETTFTGAFMYLRQKGLLGPDRPGGRRGQGYSDETRAEAQYMLDELGMSFTAIATTLGYSYNTVRRWLDIEYRRDRDAKAKKYKARRRAELSEARRAAAVETRDQRIAAAVREAGGDLAKAYSLATRLDGVLGKAREDAKNSDQRLAINEAHAHRDKMMDAIVRALGVS